MEQTKGAAGMQFFPFFRPYGKKGWKVELLNNRKNLVAQNYSYGLSDSGSMGCNFLKKTTNSSKNWIFRNSANRSVEQIKKIKSSYKF